MTPIKSIMVITFAVLIIMVFLKSEAFAMQSVTVTGYVKTTYDENDNLVSVVLQMEDDSYYRITLDDKGWELGEYYDDQWLEVTGELIEDNDGSWITIESFREAEVIENEDEEWPEDEDPWPDEGYG